MAVVAALAWRVIWGLLGPPYARFASFAYRPGAVLAYLGDGGRRRYLGHNPLGAMMVFALLAVLAAIGATGVMTLGGLLKQGPLRAFLSYATGRWTLDLHNLLAILLLAMIAAHLAGVAFESWRSREALVAAMLTGRKPAQPPASDTPAPSPGHPRAALAIMLAVLALSAGAVAGLAALPGRGVPPPALDPVFAEQCGACHLAFPPSLAPASTWNAILADLQHHFGCGCEPVAGPGRTDPELARCERRRALGTPAVAPAAYSRGQRVTAHHRHAGLAPAASWHRGGGVHGQPGLSPQQLRRLPCRRRDRAVCAAGGSRSLPGLGLSRGGKKEGQGRRPWTPSKAEPRFLRNVCDVCFPFMG